MSDLMTMTRLMRKSARHNWSELSLIDVDEGVELTYNEAWERGVQLANGLLAAGVEPQDRIGVLEENELGAQDLFAAGAIGNFVRVPLYARDSVDQQMHMLENTQCRALVISPHLADELEELAPSLSELDLVLVRDDDYEDWLADQDDADPHISASEDDFFIIRHTGGTTGAPKGVPYTHRQWVGSGRDLFYIFPPVARGDLCLHVGPITHAAGYLYGPVYLAGGTNVFSHRFDAKRTMEIIESRRVKYVWMAPTMLNAVTRLPDIGEYDTESLEVLMVSAAPITEDTTLRARKIFGDVLYQVYGSTEAAPVTAMGSQDWFAEIAGSEPLQSAGRPLSFTDVQIRDSEGQSLEANKVGVIAVQTEASPERYWDDSEESARRFVDGWVITDDVGKLDENGYLYMLDRRSNVIVTGGFSVWPMELENAISKHPDIIEVAVFGVPHEKWGETPAAVCVVENETSITEDEITELVEKQLGNYKRPGLVVVREESLPKTPVGKIDRKALQKDYWGDSGRRVHGV